MKPVVYFVNNRWLSLLIGDYLKNYDIRAVELDELDGIEKGYMGIFLDLTQVKDISTEVLEKVTASENAIVSVLIQNILITYSGEEAEISITGDRPGVYVSVHIPLKKKELFSLIREFMEKKEDPRVIMIKNVLSRKLMEQDMERLAARERMSREFIDTFSHDIGLPLTSLKGNISKLKTEYFSALSEEQKKAMEAIEKGVERIESMRKETLFLNKMDSGLYKVKKKLTSVSGIVEDSVNDIMDEVDRKNQSIETNISYISAHVDPEKFRHVVDNLLSNAVRYTPEGGKIWVSLEKDKEKFRLLVKDNGPGVPEGMEEKIFERFVTAGEKRKDSTGLGLAIVKKIVESHGGEVWLEHPKEGGSLFVVEMPR